ncbi:MAG: excinuclease ABC subunit UvrA, partial [Haemophilus parainfluenzae]
YLRLLFARVGEPRCPDHDVPLTAQTISQMVDKVLSLPEESKMMLLAPVVKNRKGEHVKLLDSLAAQGYIRARIDGEICDLSDPPELALQKKHTIEVVVDRFKVRSDLATRLAESFETALELSGGTAVVADMDDPKAEELVFSANFACPHCGYSVPELEPRLFSFNNPAGACPTCDGLGVQQFFDESRVVQNESISLAGGAVKGWDRRNFYYYQMLTSLAKHYKFDIETPYEDLPQKIKDIVMHGSGKEEIEFQYMNDRGDVVIRKHPFEGILNNMARRYKETESMSVREELAKNISNRPCTDCGGSRLRPEARNVYIGNINLPQISEKSIGESLEFFQGLTLTGQKAQIAEKILKEIRERLEFLVNVGLNYLSLSRSAETLSGGEAQRIRLASQIGAGLVGVMYVLDEPSIGLHQRDNERLLNTLIHLRNLGNTVIVVEHDEDAIREADHIIDIGPGAGVHGGQVIAQGTAKEIMANPNSITGKFLSGEEKIEIPKKRTALDKSKLLKLKGATGNNLKGVNLEIPVGLFTCITGVSGSGKSTLINDTLFPLAQNALNRAEKTDFAPYKSIEGLEYFDKVIDINQSPIGRTPRSNPATYTGLFTPIRELFAGVPEARARGYNPGRFSFNVRGGRCEACQGDGVLKVEMHFLPDVYVPCDQCKGKRYNRETLEIRYKGKTIHQVLDMTVEEAREFFDAIPMIARKLQTLMDVGLSYIRLGQSSTTLSGGEAQRVKLATELSKRDTGKTLYILDEPTTGLHFADIKQLLEVLHRLRDQGNTIVVIEHNLDVIKTADWIVDLGPEGGSGGGQIIATGTPEEVAKVKGSHTARFLKDILTKG